MVQRLTAKVLLGLAAALLGVSMLLAGLVRASALPETVGPLAGWTVATLAGFLLVLGGTLLAIFALPRDEPPAPSVPAHVAFAQKKARPALPMLDRVEPSLPHSVRAPVPTVDRGLANVETEIREITRRINKAGVMLATGQLSDQGYAQYVAELKQRRGSLEAHLVRAEMRRKL